MEHWPLALLLLSVPLQYWAVHMSGSNEIERVYLVSNLILRLKHFWQNVRENLHSMFSTESSTSSHIMSGISESAAVEVLEYRRRHERLSKDPHFSHFGLSLEPRSKRFRDQTLRVGQVVRHRRWGYHGVIIGWDSSAKAPSEWLELMHKDHPEWRMQTNYALLVHTGDRKRPQRTYVPEDNLEPIGYFEVEHPQRDDFFEAFDGNVYVPRPWLRTIYPLD